MVLAQSNLLLKKKKKCFHVRTAVWKGYLRSMEVPKEKDGTLGFRDSI